MSVIHNPLRVAWPSFLAAFPKPGAWTKPCRRKLRFDDNGFSVELVPIYAAARTRLPPDTIRALDLLISAIAVHGVPKKLGVDGSSLYVPHCKYRKADFSDGDTENPIPRSSPEQVAATLEAMAAADLPALTDVLKQKWATLKPEPFYFQSAREYVDHLKNWVRILEEIRRHGGGLAIEFI